MFELILGISLGVILLFVILLLITEVAATYPVWKQFDHRFSFQLTAHPPKKKEERKPLKILLLALTGVGILCILGYLISYRKEPQEIPVNMPVNVKAEKTAGVRTKLLSSSIAGQPFHFRLQTKWEDGKLYGNNQITFHSDSAWRFTECRYHLLDKDGFLVKEIIFSPEDFIVEAEPEGRIRGLVNKFNMELNLQEYQKIEKLQVVLDKKVSLSR